MISYKKKFPSPILKTLSNISSKKRYFNNSPILKNFLRKPQCDIKFVINNQHLYEQSIIKRQLINSESLLQDLKQLPANYNKIINLDSQINIIQRDRNQLENKIKQDKTLLDLYLPQIKQLKTKFKSLTTTKNEIWNSIQDLYTSLPNLLHPSVPNNEPQIIQWINKPIKTNNHNLNHVDIMTQKGLLDLEQASITSGSSSYYLIGNAALLERALINYAIDLAQSNGFTFILPPSLTRLGIIESCGFRPRDMNGEEQIYKTGKDNNFGLVATAEITLAAMGFNKNFDLNDKGIKQYVGLSRSYRAEAGANGKDTKGLYRVHEFSKVELFVWTNPIYGDQILESLKTFQINIIESLGLYGKVLNMPANDLGNPAYQKYDIEVWMPGRRDFGEVSSASNCRDFQSRRLNSKYKDQDGNLQFLYTLNGTALAVPRVIVALVENFYDPTTNLIRIPDVLVPYMNGKKFI